MKTRYFVLSRAGQQRLVRVRSAKRSQSRLGRNWTCDIVAGPDGSMIRTPMIVSQRELETAREVVGIGQLYADEAWALAFGAGR